jgi:DNA-binding Lrp family transcriptional regulator
MISAFLFINTAFGFADDVVSELNKISDIVELYRVQGIYDIIAKVSSNTEEELHDTIKNQITKIDKITTTVTLIISKQQP